MKKNKERNNQKKIEYLPVWNVRLVSVETLPCMAGNLAGLFLTAYLFYDSLVAVFFLWPVLFLIWPMEKKYIERKKQSKVLLEFKEYLLIVMNALHAGYALKPAMKNAGKDMRLIFAKGYLMEQSLIEMENGMESNIALSKLLMELSEKINLEDVFNFASVVATAQKSGGNIVKIMEKTVNRITMKIEVEKEVETTISGKKAEQIIMSMMPFGIVAYMRICNGDYLSPLYHNVVGIGLMTAALLITLLCTIWAERIVDIKV